MFVSSSIMDNVLLFMGSLLLKIRESQGFLFNPLSFTITSFTTNVSVSRKKKLYKTDLRIPIFVKQTDDNHVDTKIRSIHNTSKVEDIIEIDMEDCFSYSNFASTYSWGKRPCLMRGAFRAQSKFGREHDDDNNDDNKNHNVLQWPTWDEVLSLALDDDAESRLITHVPNNDKSWRLVLGPFEEHELDDLGGLSGGGSGDCGNNNNNSNNNNNDDQNISSSRARSTLLQPDEKWTMVLNDVDRFHPPLFDFINNNFSFIPQWRKDDGQISLSNEGGGIGPHVDDYDVFLIQMAGTRRWDIGKRIISNKEELYGIYDDLDIRILKFWNVEITNGLVKSFILEAGDVIYLPPRFAHCGTALSNGCMTLSVGLRAPSAKDMLTKVTEYVDSNVIDGAFLKRYTDENLFDHDDKCSTSYNVNEITGEIKAKAKYLLKDAIHDLLDDDEFFDSFFGKMVTETNRMRCNYPISLDDALLDDEDYEDFGDFGDAEKCVKSMISCKAVLYSAEGISWAYSITNKNQKSLPHLSCRLFVDGKKWDIKCNVDNVVERETIINLIKIISTEKELRGEKLKQYAPIPKTIETLLKDLIQKGYLYVASA